MLKQLYIQNIILIESINIVFEDGLNVLSGETGSGKSALMHTLNLVAGERADTTVIRRGAEKGVVEALFNIEKTPIVKTLLEESGIDHSDEEELIIRREIFSNGKSRAFLNNQMAQLGLLRKISTHLLGISGQHANQRLLSIENHRHMLDLFGNLQNEVLTFSKSWTEEQAHRVQLNELIQNETQRLHDIEICRQELNELQEANLKDHESEELFAEYTLLTHAEDLMEKVEEISLSLTGENSAILPKLSKNINTFEQLVKLDPTLADTAQIYHSALIELQEVMHVMRNYHSHIEHNPQRIAEIDDRLALIDRLKRKYGANITEIHAYQKQTKKKLVELEKGNIQIESLQSHLANLTKHNDILAEKLSQKRCQTAQELEQAIENELRTLNMLNVKFHCDITPQKRSSNGDNLIEFFITPNLGEDKISVKDCASGGELSRLLLALQSLLAGKEKTPTLVFDEIDANIGGETAKIVGEKLRTIAEQHQILCITHFPQVAKHASHHLQISKHEQEGRTITIVKTLDDASRQHELLRMVGGKVI